MRRSLPRTFMILWSFVALVGGVLWGGDEIIYKVVHPFIALVKGRSISQHYWFEIVHFAGLELLVASIILGGFALGMSCVWGKSENQDIRKFWFVVLGSFILIFIWLPVILLGHSEIIGRERYWWLRDDAMISMRYARNLAHGLGLVWNPGMRVEGFSNLLWTLYMSFLHLLPVPVSKVSLVVLLTNMVLGVALVPVLLDLTKTLGGNDVVAIIALMVYLFNRNIVVWGTSGLETPLLSLMFLVGIIRVLRDAQNNTPQIKTFFWIGVMMWVRADAVVLAALVILLALLINERKKQVLYYSGVSIAMFALQELFRLVYYGEWLPNTAYLKTMYWPDRYKAGIYYVLNFVWHYFPVLALSFLGVAVAKRAKKQRMILVGIVLLTPLQKGRVGLTRLHPSVLRL